VIRLTKHSHLFWLGLVTLFAFLLRYPYWEVIPASFDELNTTVHGFLIAQGKMLPLTGDDAYAGPFYPYLLAALFRAGISNPMLGRVVIMITGVLTVPATYAWVVALSRSQVAGFMAALLVAANPDLILVNSHIGGASFLVPFFTTLFLYLLTKSLNEDKPGWLALAAVSAGLALQSNPIAVLLVASSGLWILWQTRSKTRLGQHWPLWPVLIGLVIAFVYSPVIVYNLRTQFGTVDVVQERSYLWEDNPSIQTTLSNLKRLSLQTTRQVSGVLAGSETAAALFGVPLIFLALMLAGLVYTTRYVSALPLAVLIPFWLVLPVVSSHYGFISVGRFTTQLIPVWAAVIAIFLAAGLARLQQVEKPGSNGRAILYISLFLLLILSQIAALFQYYQFINTAHLSSKGTLGLSRYVVEEHQGERVYISAIEAWTFLADIPYIPHTVFLMGDVHHEFLPPQQIIGRLFEHPGAAFLLLTNEDAEIVREVAPLEWVDTPANEEARQRGYGLYRLTADTPLPKPDFVFQRDEIPANLEPVSNFAESLKLLGCEIPAAGMPGESLALACYWESTAPMPPDSYVAFVHLFDPAAGTLITQDDHIMGQERYPLNAWQPGEIIKEQYTLNVPADTAVGEYQLLLGVYTWPDLIRLAVPDNPDNVVVIPLQLGE
jgi:4-amino-4-deoxy-L-arabinose transferase-like glycosyltransferase